MSYVDLLIKNQIIYIIYMTELYKYTLYFLYILYFINYNKNIISAMIEISVVRGWKNDTFISSKLCT